MGIIIRNGKQYGFSGKVGTASSVLYDNTNSQIEVATVQEAIDYILENGVSGGGLLEVDLTKVEYEEMVAQDVIVDNVTYYITDDDDEYNANTIVYDNTDTGLESGNVQGAITEINAKVNEQNKKLKCKEIDFSNQNICYVIGKAYKFGDVVTLNYKGDIINVVNNSVLGTLESEFSPRYDMTILTKTTTGISILVEVQTNGTIYLKPENIINERVGFNLTITYVV